MISFHFSFFFFSCSSLAHSLVEFSSFGAIFNSGDDFSVFVVRLCAPFEKVRFYCRTPFFGTFFAQEYYWKNYNNFRRYFFVGVISSFPMIHQIFFHHLLSFSLLFIFSKPSKEMFYEFENFISFNLFFFYFILIFYLRFDCFLFIDFQLAIQSENAVLNRSTFSHNFPLFVCLPIYFELMCIIVVNFGDEHNLWMFTMDWFEPYKCHLAEIVGLFENKCCIRVRIPSPPILSIVFHGCFHFVQLKWITVNWEHQRLKFYSTVSAVSFIQ